MLGTLYIISAPSGAGKSSLIKELIKRNPMYDLKVSISHTTREPRPKEEDAIHYHFVNHEQFAQMIKEEAFLEYAQVFDNFYGTSQRWIEENLNNGIDIFLDIDWQGARQIREKMPHCVSIFILPPSKQELERRLISRGQDNEEVIAHRMEKATLEMSHYGEYDYLIVNDDFELSIMDIKAIIRGQRLRQEKQGIKYRSMIDTLLN